MSRFKKIVQSNEVLRRRAGLLREVSSFNSSTHLPLGQLRRHHERERAGAAEASGQVCGIRLEKTRLPLVAREKQRRHAILVAVVAVVRRALLARTPFLAL